MKHRFAPALLALLLCAAAGCQTAQPSPAADPSGAGSAASSAAASPSAGGVSSSGAVSSGSVDSSEPETASPAAVSSSPEQTRLRGMTLEQKVGQMFFLCFRKDTDGTDLWTCNSTVRGTIRSIQPGGIVLFGENIHTTAQVRGLIQDMKRGCSTPPFLGVDQEGGTVQRIGHTALIPATTVPSMWTVGRTGSVSLAREVGGVLGSELTVFGFNLDFAPVCDVFSNPKNTVIGTRAFSDDPQKCADFSVALSKGLRSQGIIPVCKHFPGHGDTSADTHAGYAAVNKTLDELRKTELVPFRAQVQSGAEMVMVAHISLPKVTGGSTPATLSPEVVQGLLRSKFGFSGVIITDAMNMGAVANHYSSGEAAVLAVKAGDDMLLMPADPQAAFSAVLRAVKSGEISEARVDESVLRILALKERYGLFTEKPLGDASLLGCAEHRRVMEKVG